MQLNKEERALNKEERTLNKEERAEQLRVALSGRHNISIVEYEGVVDDFINLACAACGRRWKIYKTHVPVEQREDYEDYINRIRAVVGCPGDE